MGLEQVKNEIVENAEQEADRIIEEAEEQADDIISGAEEQAEQIRDQAQQHAEAEAESLKREKIASANMEAKQAKLEAKQRVIQEAFSGLEDDISDLSTSKKKELFKTALNRIQNDIDIGIVHTSDDMQDAVSDLVDVDVKTDSIQGFIAESEDGSVRYDYTFQTILDAITNDNRKTVAQKLF
jgi:V/A-type H+-transporting ATPase subunit E